VLSFLMLSACADSTATGLSPLTLADSPRLAVLSRENAVLPLDQTFHNSCAGEDVRVTGDLHLVTMTVERPDGTIADVFHTNFRNAVGTGLLSGASYRATSAESAPFQGVPPGPPGGPWRSTHEGTLHLVAISGGSSLLWHFVFVVTKEPGSPPTAIVFKNDVSCT
jgi:hypothetical protein